MNLVRLLTVPYVRRHRLRCLLTVAGVALGVAVFIAMHGANRAALSGFSDTVTRIAGRAALQVTAGEAGMDEAVLDRVRDVREVAAAAPVIEAVADTGLTGESNLLILAVDMIGDSSVRDYHLEADAVEVADLLEFLAQPDSLIVTREFADRNGLTTGSTLVMRTMNGVKRFTIRGLLRSGGMSSAFGGNLAVMDIYAAQQVFGRGRKFDRIDIVVAEGTAVEQAEIAVQAALGPAFAVDPPELRNQSLAALLAGYSVLMTMTSALALVIGMFVVYNAFAVAVTERRTEIGIIRALGATRRQVQMLFLFESVLVGALGAIAGMAVGRAATGVLSVLTADLVTALSGMPQASDHLALGRDLFGAATVGGILTSIVAAWLPARTAARLDPVQALQKGRTQTSSTRETRGRHIAAMAAAAAASVCLFEGSTSVFYWGYGLMTLAVLLLVPTLSAAFARRLTVPLRAVFPVEGALAADSLIQAPKRTAAAVAGLMLSVAVTIAMAGVGRASLDSIEEWVTTVFNADLLVSTSGSLNARSFHFPASMPDELERLPGVAGVQSVRSIVVPVNRWPVMIVAVQMQRSAKFNYARPIVAGDRDTMYRLAGEGRGAIVSESLTILQKLRLGDTIELPAPEGVLTLPIVGVFRDYSNQTGAIYIDLGLFRRAWRDNSLDLVHVYLSPGVDPLEMRRRILTHFEADHRLFVLLNADVRRYVSSVGNQWFNLTYVQIAVAVLVAILGIVNTITVSIVDRKRELGVLRAIGGHRRQVKRTLCIEAVAIAFIGTVLGISMGAANLLAQLEVARRSVLAMPLDYRFPVGIAVAILPTMLIVAFISALAPAEAAVRAPLITALEYE